MPFLHLANRGKLVVVVEADEVAEVLSVAAM